MDTSTPQAQVHEVHPPLPVVAPSQVPAHPPAAPAHHHPAAPAHQMGSMHNLTVDTDVTVDSTFKQVFVSNFPCMAIAGVLNIYYSVKLMNMYKDQEKGSSSVSSGTKPPAIPNDLFVWMILSLFFWWAPFLNLVFAIVFACKMGFRISM